MNKELPEGVIIAGKTLGWQLIDVYDSNTCESVMNVREVDLDHGLIVQIEYEDNSDDVFETIIVGDFAVRWRWDA